MSSGDTEARDTNLAALLARRHSCRAFLPEALPRSTIVNMLELAQRAPSWCNTQPWLVHLLSGAPSLNSARPT